MTDIVPLPRLQLSFEDAALALGVPLSTLEQVHRAGGGPTFFKIGRRLYTTTALIAEWQAGKIAAAKAEGRELVA